MAAELVLYCRIDYACFDGVLDDIAYCAVELLLLSYEEAFVSVAVDGSDPVVALVVVNAVLPVQIPDQIREGVHPHSDEQVVVVVHKYVL